MKSFYRFLMVTGFICVLMVVQGCRSNLKTPENPQFTLEWEDHLDSYDTSRWETGSHTFRNNVAQFDPENVSFQDGTMRLHRHRTNPVRVLPSSPLKNSDGPRAASRRSPTF